MSYSRDHRYDVVRDKEVLQRIVTLSDNSFRERSCVIAIPTKWGTMTGPAEHALQHMIRPLNAGKSFPFCYAPAPPSGHLCHDKSCEHGRRQMEAIVRTTNMEVGRAYNAIFAHILKDSAMRSCKYVLCFEADMVPPPRGLIALYDMMDEYDIAQGLYYERKHNDFVPMTFGRWNEKDGGDDAPFVPELGQHYRMNACAMGFTLIKMDVLKHPFWENDWCKTVEDHIGAPVRIGQDMYFTHRAAILGFKIGLDARILCGHYDAGTNQVVMGPEGGAPRVVYPEDLKENRKDSDPASEVAAAPANETEPADPAPSQS